MEPPAGDKTRFLDGMGASFFPVFNRGKKSVVLDLNRNEGRKALAKLLQSADIFVENFRRSPLENPELNAEMVRKRNPGLIAVACKGFLSGPYEDRSALDEVVQMMTGLAYMTGPADRPLRVGSSVNDIMGGLFGAYGAMAALEERRKTRKGRDVRVGLFENSLLLVAQHMAQFELLGVEPPPMPDREFSWPVYDIFESSDGLPIFVGAVTEGQWDCLCGLLGLERLLADPSLRTRTDQIAARSRTLPEFRKAIAEWEFADLCASFEENGIPFAPVLRPAQMYGDPQANAGGLPKSALPNGTAMRAPGLPLEFGGQRAGSEIDVPGLGADSEAILASLGLSKAAIAKATGMSK